MLVSNRNCPGGPVRPAWAATIVRSPGDDRLGR